MRDKEQWLFRTLWGLWYKYQNSDSLNNNDTEGGKFHMDDDIFRLSFMTRREQKSSQVELSWRLVKTMVDNICETAELKM